MIKKIDHVVITTGDIEKCINFYKILGFEIRTANGRYEIFADGFKINVHILGKELSPHALNINVGSADLCFEIEGCIEKYKSKLLSEGVSIELGVVKKSGHRGQMNSIYLRDPDGNLIEFCSYK